MIMTHREYSVQRLHDGDVYGIEIDLQTVRFENGLLG